MRLHALVVLLAALSAPAAAQHYLAKPQTIGGNPGPAHNYVCPNVERGSALDCYLDAVRHLYRMCKHVKSIEIIEFGYERSEEGTNSAKSQYCLDKQKGNIATPYQTALKEARLSKPIADRLRELHDYWLASLAALKWRNGENDEQYQLRTASVFPSLEDQISTIRATITEARANAAPPAAASAKAKR